MIVSKLRGAVRLPSAERLMRALTRELGQPDLANEGLGHHTSANECANCVLYQRDSPKERVFTQTFDDINIFDRARVSQPAVA